VNTDEPELALYRAERRVREIQTKLHRLRDGAHNVPGRKTDVADSLWIAQLIEHGLVSPSFVPPRPVRLLRDLTRHGRRLTEERTRTIQRLEKVLQDAGIKLTSVASTILGKTGRAILAALLAGEEDPAVLAELAKGRLRPKIPALREALTHRFRVEHHGLLIAQMLAHIDGLEAAIAETYQQVEVLLRPVADKVELVMTIPGVGRRVAEVLIAELGSPSALLRRGPLRTVHAIRHRTRLKQASGTLRVGVLASCACGPEARADRRRGSSGFGSRPVCRVRPGERGSRRRSPAGPRSATSVPIPVGIGVAGRR
jgi:transposase